MSPASVPVTAPRRSPPRPRARPTPRPGAGFARRGADSTTPLDVDARAGPARAPAAPPRSRAPSSSATPRAAARPAEPQLRDAVVDAEQLDVAAVGLHVRPHAVESLADPLLDAHGVQVVREHEAGDDPVLREPRRRLLVERGEDALQTVAVELHHRSHELVGELAGMRVGQLLRLGREPCRRSTRSAISTCRSGCAPPCGPSPCRSSGTCAPRRAGTGRTSGRPA